MQAITAKFFALLTNKATEAKDATVVEVNLNADSTIESIEQDIKTQLEITPDSNWEMFNFMLSSYEPNIANLHGDIKNHSINLDNLKSVLSYCDDNNIDAHVMGAFVHEYGWDNYRALGNTKDKTMTYHEVLDIIFADSPNATYYDVKDTLGDGEALAKLGFTDEHQLAIEEAYDWVWSQINMETILD